MSALLDEIYHLIQKLEKPGPFFAAGEVIAPPPPLRAEGLGELTYALRSTHGGQLTFETLKRGSPRVLCIHKVRSNYDVLRAEREQDLSLLDQLAPRPTP